MKQLSYRKVILTQGDYKTSFYMLAVGRQFHLTYNILHLFKHTPSLRKNAPQLVSLM